MLDLYQPESEEQNCESPKLKAPSGFEFIEMVSAAEGVTVIMLLSGIYSIINVSH